MKKDKSIFNTVTKHCFYCSSFLHIRSFLWLLAWPPAYCLYLAIFEATFLKSVWLWRRQTSSWI